MNEVFWEYLNHFVIIYIHVILVYSQNETEHHHHVALVLERLLKFHLFLKAEKCEFHQMAIQFLGYNTSPEGIQLDEGKVEAVKSWPVSTTIKELQYFLGLGYANFYHQFIQNYSSIPALLTSLLKSNSKSLSWTPEATHAFQQLKQVFKSAHLLIHSDPNKPKQS